MKYISFEYCISFCHIKRHRRKEETMQKQEVVLITGCSSGIGLSTAIYLAKKGFKVYASLRNLEKKHILLSEAEKSGVLVKLVQLDVADEKSVKEAVCFILKEEGRIEVLINNAGFGSGGFFEDFSMEEIREQFETNFFGLVRVTKEVLPTMRKQGKGCIVNISSIGGKIAFPVISIYNASKFAVEALTESLRIELASFGIKVVAIEPSSVKTNFSSSVKVAKMSTDSSSPYYAYMKRFNTNISKISQQSEEPITVAKNIHKAITSESPRKSYFVGSAARMLLAMKLILPNSVFERMIGKMFLN